MTEEKKALIFDDDNLLLTILKRNLNKMGYNTTTILVNREQSFDDFLKEHSHILSSFNSSEDLIITDFDMGEITGEHIIKFFEARDFKGILCCMTGNPEKGEEMKERYGIEFIKKPCTDLKKIINEIINSHNANPHNV